MASVLQHYFDPEFDFTHLIPKEDSHGRVDHYNLGYVQNIVKNQIVAEIIPASEINDQLDERYYTQVDSLPVGPNTFINPDNPKQIIAAANGYVFYHDGRITVKKLLNIRRDLDFHTGNVVFVGDLCVHGIVKTGFEAHGKNILVKGIIEGAKLRSRGNIVTESGVKGAKQALLEAKEHIRAPFCENAELSAQKDIVIDGSCMHSDIWVGGNLLIKGRLQGGSVHSNGVVYVEEQIGGGSTTVTSIYLGYPPFLFREITRIEDEISQTVPKLEHYKHEAAKDDIRYNEYKEQIVRADKKLQALYRRRKMLNNKLNKSDNAQHCCIVAPGVIRPGVEISIGGAYCKVTDYIENVRVSLHDNEIVFTSPAINR